MQVLGITLQEHPSCHHSTHNAIHMPFHAWKIFTIFCQYEMVIERETEIFVLEVNVTQLVFFNTIRIEPEGRLFEYIINNRTFDLLTSPSITI